MLRQLQWPARIPQPLDGRWRRRLTTAAAPAISASCPPSTPSPNSARLTSNYSAEYGLSSAGTMTMVFKSGTKDFHAGAWEFFATMPWMPANLLHQCRRAQAPELRFNTYGFNVGGPVFIPKVYNKNRDKTFFFYNMEWRKLIQGGLRQPNRSARQRVRRCSSAPPYQCPERSSAFAEHCWLRYTPSV